MRLEPVLAEARNAAESGPMAVLVEHLSEAQARIDAKRPELGSAVERFNLCLTGFPNAWIADLLGVRPIRAGATTRAEG